LTLKTVVPEARVEQSTVKFWTEAFAGSIAVATVTREMNNIEKARKTFFIGNEGKSILCCLGKA
jgi:hypothetical protein